MSHDWQSCVREFHEAFGLLVSENPTISIPVSDLKLRRNLYEEEIAELNEAMATGDIVEIADAVADSVYVLLGLCVSLGIDLAPIFAEVHRANMEKRGGYKREDGKWCKPSGWVAPKIAECLKDQGWEGE